MTLRARLAIGLASIALILLVPLLLALHALRTTETSARALREAEFAASLLVGRSREALEDVRAAENALLFVHDEPSRARMARELDRARGFADSLSRFGLAESSELASAIASIRVAADTEYTAATSGNPQTAERISTRTILPLLSSMQRSLARAEAALRERTQERVVAVADATDAAVRFSGGALAIGALLALLIAIWLMRSISRPVRDFERGMRAVAEGDFAYRLPFGAMRRDEFGRLAASYESMAHQLADLDRLKAEFISVASHELKTPINVIAGYLELLQEGIYGELTPQQLEICVTIEKQSKTLTRLANQLLDVSRFEAGGGRVEPKPMDLRRFANALESTFHVLAVQREIDFRVELAPNLPPEVSWDEDRMNEVVGNLLSNAFKFTGRGGKVTLALDSVDSSVRISVRDTGRGIPPDQLQHVFRKFYQVDERAAAAGGAGLGLAIAKEIVDAHRGTLTVDSIENVGTTFVITLPVRVLALGTSGKHRATDLAQTS